MRKFLALLIILSLTSFGQAVFAEKKAAKPPSPNAPIVLDEKKFQAWLADFKKDAVKEGISQKTLDAALKDIKPLEKVIKLDRKQPEFTMTHAEYIQKIVPKSRKNKARKRYKQNKTLLERVGKHYGVQPRFIVALWGVETDFGARMGNYYIPEALATLAFEGRRSKFFRKELMDALKILDQGHISPKNMKGSWAGAMGQTQFMPSSFLASAEDFDGDGRRDIWKNKEDAFASIANYLKNTRWDDDITWGRKVKLPKGFNMKLEDKKKDLSEWQKLGVRRADGSDLPERKLNATLVLPGGEKGDAFLVYENYKRLLKWNRSDYFATAVGILSDAIR